MLISDVTGDKKDPVANRTIDKERIVTLACAKCGTQIVGSYLKKPIPKNAWEEHWSSILFDFIHGIEVSLVTRDDPEDPDGEEAFLRGIVKGMWAVYRIIESQFVQGNLVKGTKTTYQLCQLSELLVAEKPQS